MTDTTSPHPPSALERTEAALRACDLWNPSLKAMISTMPDAARRRAAELDEAAARGEWQGLLHGMPISLKDNIDCAGEITTGGSIILKDNRANRDAAITARLRSAGAVIIGKANLHEWCFGPTSQSKHYGPVRNPWNTACIPGGSSGGSGAALAAGIGEGSIGSDTGGSVRIPSAFNGVSGLRPTRGRISNRGSLGVSAPYDTLGPMARRVSDVARIFAVVAGYDDEDPISVDRPVPNILARLDDPVRGLRLGVMRRWFFDGLHPDLERALDAALATFRDLGVEIVEIDLGDIERAQSQLGFKILLADAYALHKEQIASRREDYGEDVLERFAIGAAVTGAEYADALRWKESLFRRLEKTFRSVDVIFSPTAPGPAPRADGAGFIETIREITRYTYPWAFFEGPSLAMPCGFTADRMPLGMQLVAPWWEEERLLRLGHAFQKVTDHHLRRPARPS